MQCGCPRPARPAADPRPAIITPQHPRPAQQGIRMTGIGRKSAPSFSAFLWIGAGSTAQATPLRTRSTPPRELRRSRLRICRIRCPLRPRSPGKVVAQHVKGGATVLSRVGAINDAMGGYLRGSGAIADPVQVALRLPASPKPGGDLWPEMPSFAARDQQPACRPSPFWLGHLRTTARVGPAVVYALVASRSAVPDAARLSHLHAASKMRWQQRYATHHQSNNSVLTIGAGQASVSFAGSSFDSFNRHVLRISGAWVHVHTSRLAFAIVQDHHIYRYRHEMLAPCQCCSVRPPG